MTDPKLKTPMSKTQSSFMKDINRLKKTIDQHKRTISKRNILIGKYELFIKKLLEEKRTTKTELSKFITK